MLTRTYFPFGFAAAGASPDVTGADSSSTMTIVITGGSSAVEVGTTSGAGASAIGIGVDVGGIGDCVGLGISTMDHDRDRCGVGVLLTKPLSVGSIAPQAMETQTSTLRASAPAIPDAPIRPRLFPGDGMC